MKPLLDIESLKAWYGASQVLFGVDLTLREGEVTAMLGRNGMGKSTTINAICGMQDRWAGRIDFGGRTLTGMPIHQIARLGIGLVPEGRRVFANLSVTENLTAAATRGYWTLPRIFEYFPRLKERAGQSAETLSGGEQQMLVIGRALMTNPRLLILDEATEGLAPVIRSEIWETLHRLKSEGLSVLIVDGALKELLELADHCSILERGKTVWSGVPTDLSTEISGRFLGI
jgi:branched-chain amino acid transport system ATP-binding protein